MVTAVVIVLHIPVLRGEKVYADGSSDEAIIPDNIRNVYGFPYIIFHSEMSKGGYEGRKLTFRHSYYY